MSKMGNKVLDLYAYRLKIQELIETYYGAPEGLTLEEIAEKAEVPLFWVEAELEAMTEAGWG